MVRGKGLVFGLPHKARALLAMTDEMRLLYGACILKSKSRALHTQRRIFKFINAHKQARSSSRNPLARNPRS